MSKYERPSDMLTAKVIAMMNGPSARFLHYAWCNKTDTDWFEDRSGNEYDDPRSCTDAALKLFAWLRVGFLNQVQLTEDGGHWLAYTQHGIAALPISEEPFRYAVVRFAADVMGIKEGGSA